MSTPRAVTDAAKAAYKAKIKEKEVGNSRLFRDKEDQTDFNYELSYKDVEGKMCLKTHKYIKEQLIWANVTPTNANRTNLKSVINSSDLFIEVEDNDNKCSGCKAVEADPNTGTSAHRGKSCFFPIVFGYSVYRHCLACIRAGASCDATLAVRPKVPRGKPVLPAKKTDSYFAPLEKNVAFLESVVTERQQRLDAKVANADSSTESLQTLQHALSDAHTALENCLSVLELLSDAKVVGLSPKKGSTSGPPPTAAERLVAAKRKIEGSIEENKKRRGE